jgi:hypothetical protein
LFCWLRSLHFSRKLHFLRDFLLRLKRSLRALQYCLLGLHRSEQLHHLHRFLL